MYRSISQHFHPMRRSNPFILIANMLHAAACLFLGCHTLTCCQSYAVGYIYIYMYPDWNALKAQQHNSIKAAALKRKARRSTELGTRMPKKTLETDSQRHCFLFWKEWLRRFCRTVVEQLLNGCSIGCTCVLYLSWQVILLPWLQRTDTLSAGKLLWRDFLMQLRHES